MSLQSVSCNPIILDGLNDGKECTIPKLTARKVETLKVAGLHGDGGGLYLSVKSSGAKSWILRTVVHGQRRDLGLGSASLVTLAEAREKARTLRKVAREGGDPDALRKRESDPTRKWQFFEACHSDIGRNPLRYCANNVTLLTLVLAILQCRNTLIHDRCRKLSVELFIKLAC